MQNELIVHSDIVLFLGAGASVPLGLKTTAPFMIHSIEQTSRLMEQYHIGSNRTDWKVALESFYGLAAKQIDAPIPDSEIVLDYLKQMEDSVRELSQFPESLKLGAGTDLAIDPYDYLDDRLGSIRRALQTVIVEHYSEVDGTNAYNLYEPLLVALSDRSKWPPIFTTNYDWTFEQLEEVNSEKVKLVDGFRLGGMGVRWERGVFDSYVPSYKGTEIVLFKLHGSTSWYRGNSTNVIMKYPNAAPVLPGSTAVVIYPTGVKGEMVDEEPFKAAYEYFESTLKNARLCVIIGTSFRDAAINEIFAAALRENFRLKFCIVDPSINRSPGVKFEEILTSLRIEKDRWSEKLRVVVGRFGDDPFVMREIGNSTQGISRWNELESWITR